MDAQLRRGPHIAICVYYLRSKEHGARLRIEAANYNLDMKTRVLNRRTNLGKMYFENIYIMTISKVKAKAT